MTRIIERNVKTERELYLEELIDADIDYLDYWLDTQDRYSNLFNLAMSLYHRKLSTADVERCFSISKRVLENRFSLSSTNLKRTMILRNRLKCFGLGNNSPPVNDIPFEQWIEDDESDMYRVGNSMFFASERNDDCEPIFCRIGF